MRLLLDTHIWLWALLEPERLTPNVRAAMASPDNELWLSPISVWEAFMLAERGRVAVSGPVGDWIRDMVSAMPRREAPLTHEIAILSMELSLPHQDPADRFLVATARAFDLTLVSADERLLGHPGFSTLANR